MTPAELAAIRDRAYAQGIVRDVQYHAQATRDRDELLAEVDRLLAALRSADSVPRGLYRNPGGFELRVGFAASEQTAGIRTIAGDIAVATSYDPMFGTWTYLVTAASLRECGYELVEPEASDG